MGIKHIKSKVSRHINEFSETNGNSIDKNPDTQNFSVYNLTRDISDEISDVAERTKRKGEKEKKQGKFPKKLAALGAVVATGYGANKAARRHIQGQLIKAGAAHKAGDRQKAKQLRTGRGMGFAKGVAKYTQQPVNVVDKGMKTLRETLTGKPETRRQRMTERRRNAKRRAKDIQSRQKSMAKTYEKELKDRIKASGAEKASKIEGDGFAASARRELARRSGESQERNEATEGKAKPGKGLKARFNRIKRALTKQRSIRIPFTNKRIS